MYNSEYCAHLFACVRRCACLNILGKMVDENFSLKILFFTSFMREKIDAMLLVAF